MKWLVEVVAVLLSLAFIICGLWGRLSILNQNECKMTFTSMQKSAVKVETSLSSVGELYRHPSAQLQPKLNKQPVLFIPGNMGKADQVRSLSSPMHNDDNYFQYFAVDFNGMGMEVSALHGASVLTQAAFVNDAIRAILKLYVTLEEYSSVFCSAGLLYDVGWSGASEGLNLLQSHPTITLAYHIDRIILIITHLSTPKSTQVQRRRGEEWKG